MGDGSLSMDISCLMVLILVFFSDLLSLISIARFNGKPSPNFDVKAWEALDVDYIKTEYEEFQGWVAFDNITSMMNAIAMFALLIPIFQVCWILSGRGKRRINTHVLIMIIAIAGGMSELIANLLMTGVRGGSAFIARSVELDDWGLAEEGIGWKVLELTDAMASSLVTWVNAFEYLSMFLIFFFLWMEVKFEHIRIKTLKREGQTTEEETFDENWAAVGVIIGVLGLIEFMAQVMRVTNWRAWTIITRLMSMSSMLVLVPIWLIMLGRKLPRLRTAFEEQQEREGGFMGVRTNEGLME